MRKIVIAAIVLASFAGSAALAKWDDIMPCEITFPLLMPYAIHNIHTPAVEIDEAGTMTRDGYARIPLPEPLFVGTAEGVEAWRLDRLKRVEERPV